MGISSMGIPVYSYFPAIPMEIEQLQRLSKEWMGRNFSYENRDRYRRLPWTMEELDGSFWNNLPTGSHKKAVLGEYHGGEGLRKSLMLIPFDYDGDRLVHLLSDTMGFWWTCSMGQEREEKRYIVEHWVRTDHWPPGYQIQFFDIGINRLQKEIDCSREKLALWKAGKAPGSSRTFLKRTLAYDEKRLTELMERKTRFADEHGIRLSLSDRINVGMLCSKQAQQLRLL